MRLQALMTQAGFVEVEVRTVSLPLSGWSSGKHDHVVGSAPIVVDSLADPHEQAIGMMNRENVHQLLSSLAVYPFTESLG
jgi:hypothetical protein